jgi:cyclohexyl-isocyanide hydratase
MPTEKLQPGQPFTVAMLLFPGVTQLDMTGPLEVFGRVRGVSVQLVAKSRDAVSAASLTPPAMQILPSACVDDIATADLLCVPGGPGHIDLLNDAETLAFLRRVAASARYVTSVCTGSLVLGAAGLLRGYRATTHWNSMHCLAALGAVPVEQRVVIDRNRITGGGVTSGIDFALQVIREVWGDRPAQQAELTLEYNPSPPMGAGSPRTAPTELVEHVRTIMKPVSDRQAAAIELARVRLAQEEALDRSAG